MQLTLKRSMASLSTDHGARQHYAKWPEWQSQPGPDLAFPSGPLAQICSRPCPDTNLAHQTRAIEALNRSLANRPFWFNLFVFHLLIINAMLKLWTW
jgi:hypothetical protein